MRYEVKFIRYGTGSHSEMSKVFRLSMPFSDELDREIRRYYHISNTDRIEIISVCKE